MKWENLDENFLIERLKEEWKEVEKATKKHEFKQRALAVGRPLAKALFSLLLIGGVVMIAAVAPNMLAAFGKFGRQYRFFSESKRLREKIYALKKGKYISVIKNEDSYIIRLTPKGKMRALKLLVENLRIKKLPDNNGKMWLVMFDIPRKHNGARDAFRERLRTMGMEKLQNSVFVSKYPCRKEVEFWSELCNVSDFVKIVRADGEDISL